MTQARTAPRNLFALIPMKPFSEAKSRLREALPQRSREALALAMFERVLSAAVSCNALQRVAVLTYGADVAHCARRAGAHVLYDVTLEAPSLALQIDTALGQLALLGADAAVVLMADLPFVESEDIAQLAAGLQQADLVLAPDARGASTNALGLRLPTALGTAFGDPASYTRHARRARELEWDALALPNPRLAHDVDVRDDLPHDGAWAVRSREFFDKLPS